jgi:two-component sensor histidine kinase
VGESIRDRSLSEDERARLMPELHNCVKNNLQLVDSLLLLQALRADEATGRQLRLARGRIRALALAYDHVREVAGVVDVRAYFEGLVAELLRRHGGTRGRVSVAVQVAAPAALPVEHALRCGLIVAELVANGLEHAFPAGRRGRLVVSLFTGEGGRVGRLVVADDGVGLPAGFDLGALTSLGLRLVSELAQQLRGRLDVRTASGTEIQIAFP